MTLYSHDGIRDALTQLAAPPLLYEELRREIARSARVNEEITLVRFVLAHSDFAHQQMDNLFVASHHEVIVNFAHSLARLSRDEDICARMGECEFLCLLHGKGESAGAYIARISADWRERKEPRTGEVASHDWRLEVASLVSNPGENALDLLNRLDREILTSCR